MKKQGRRYNLSKEKEDEIFEYFKTNHNNEIPVIAKKFGISTWRVSRIIDKRFCY